MTLRALIGAGAAAAVLATAGCAVDPAPPAADPAGAPDPAAAPTVSAGFALVPDAPGAVARVSAPPGGEAVVALRVANASDATRTLALASRVPWMTVAPEVSVPPRQSAPVTAVVRVPPDAPAVLRGTVVARAQGDRGAVVSVSYESAADVAVRVLDARR
ncbi:MAG: hypothetical protein AB7V62_03095 [Thermoleophilia bacterium]